MNVSNLQINILSEFAEKTLVELGLLIHDLSSQPNTPPEQRELIKEIYDKFGAFFQLVRSK